MHKRSKRKIAEQRPSVPSYLFLFLSLDELSAVVRWPGVFGFLGAGEPMAYSPETVECWRFALAQPEERKAFDLALGSLVVVSVFGVEARGTVTKSKDGKTTATLPNGATVTRADEAFRAA